MQSLEIRGIEQSRDEVRRERTEKLSGASMSQEDVNAALTLAAKHDGGTPRHSHSSSHSIPLHSSSLPYIYIHILHI